MVILFYQACEIPAAQNEFSHYKCDENGDLKCLPGEKSNYKIENTKIFSHPF